MSIYDYQTLKHEPLHEENLYHEDVLKHLSQMLQYGFVHSYCLY